MEVSDCLNKAEPEACPLAFVPPAIEALGYERAFLKRNAGTFVGDGQDG